MESRARQHRTAYRRVLAWSLGAAAVIHVAVFTLAPEFEVVPWDESPVESAELARDGTPTTVVQVVFGPPAITRPDGSIWEEPPNRVLRATRLTELPPLCAHLAGGATLPLRGAVRLRVSESGHARAIEFARSTGDTCGDHLLARAADALLYHWLPDDRFPAPVDLVQPVTLESVER